jgi:hypothetical protein
MTVRRPKSPELVAGIAGFALVLLLFGVNWFALDAPTEGTLGGFDAWQAFAALDIVLLAAGVLGVLIAVRGASASTSRPLAAVTGVIALVAAVFLVIRIADPPTFDSTVGSLPLSREPGAFAGLAAVVVLGIAASLPAFRRAS